MKPGLTVGIDLVEVERFRMRIRRHPRLAETIFTSHELETCRRSRNADERLAVRFAAKEAAFKALGDGWPAIRYQDVEVVTSNEGAPTLSLRARAAVLAGSRTYAVSLAHTGGLAMAEVILQEESA